MISHFVKRMVVPVVKTPGSPVWHLSWPWGMVQCWRRGDSKWGVCIGRNVGLHINAGRLEAWTKRRQRRGGGLQIHLQDGDWTQSEDSVASADAGADGRGTGA